MSFTDVMYGGLGQVNNQFQANLGQNAAMNQNNQAAIQNQNAINAANQAQLNNLYGPQGFGGQTAYYAGQGAAYGRNTGGYGGYGGMNDPFSPVGGYNSMDAAANDPASQAYFAAYPDVAASGMSAQQHYQQYGQAEGRNGFGLTGGSGAFTSGAPAYNDYGIPNFGAGAQPNYGGSPSYQGAALDPASQAYLAAYPDVAASGMSAAQHYAQYGQAEGRNGFGLSAGAMAQGGNPSWFDAGQPGGGFNTYGMPGSGNIGRQDAFSGLQNLDTPEAKYLNANPDVLAWARGSGMDYQTAARDHAARYGNNEGRDTFGMTTANPNFQQGGGFGMGSAFDPSTYGGSTGNPGMSFDQRFPAGAGSGSPGFGNYPQQPMASDNMYNQQQMIQDLYKTLGIIDNAGEFNRGGGAYNPSGNTLQPQDYFPGVSVGG